MCTFAAFGCNNTNWSRTMLQSNAHSKASNVVYGGRVVSLNACAMDRISCERLLAPQFSSNLVEWHVDLDSSSARKPICPGCIGNSGRLRSRRLSAADSQPHFVYSCWTAIPPIIGRNFDADSDCDSFPVGVGFVGSFASSESIPIHITAKTKLNWTRFMCCSYCPAYKRINNIVYSK